MDRDWEELGDACLHERATRRILIIIIIIAIIIIHVKKKNSVKYERK